MPPQIRIPSDQLADIERIRSIGSAKLQQVAEHLERLPKLPLRPGHLHEEVTRILDGDKEAAASLVRPLLALNQLIRSRATSIDDVLQGLRTSIAELRTAWSTDEQTAWADLEPQLRTLLASAAIRTVSKTIDLAYDYANLYQEARIVTDVRPVFNDSDKEALRIDGAIVSFTLRLHYDDRSGNQSLSVVMDEADIHALRHQCDRALDKAKLAMRLVTEANDLPVVVSGATYQSPNDD